MVFDQKNVYTKERGEVLALALEGVKVLDLSRLLPGPFCSMILADFGADVLKVEDTDPGDYMRDLPGLEGSYQTLNRNKQSISLNLKTDKGQEILCKLVEEADVLIEQFRPGVTKRLGIDYPVLKKLNPRLIYCSLTGYGQNGPRALNAGHDINYAALAGVLNLCGLKGQPPVLPGVQIADIGGGALWSAVAILLALIAREKTGEGQLLDIAMLDGSVSFLAAAGSVFFAEGTVPQRGESILSGSFACYRVYETADHKYLSLGALEAKFWAEFCKRLDCPAWIDEQFAPQPRQAQLSLELTKIFKSQTRAEWLDFFKDADICLEPVFDMAEAAADPHLQQRQMIVETELPDGRIVKQIGIPIKCSGTPGLIRSLAPRWGEQTRPILKELGYSDAEVEDLLALGVIK